MSRSPKCENGDCEFVPTLRALDNRELLLKRSVEEVRYGRLWAEVELPKLLIPKEPSREGNRQP